MTELELKLMLSVQQQYIIRLVHALKKYGAHTPECRSPCDCGWARDANKIVGDSLTHSLRRIA